jgi:hypothetical protein
MASLTPLSKTLIGLAVVGAMASAVWHLALKPRLAAPAETGVPVETPAAPPAAVVTPGEPAAPSTAPAAPSSSMETGSPAQQAELGRQMLAAGDFASARQHLEAAVKGGDGGAACHLGEMTLKGQGGLVADQAAAARLFQLAQSRNIICFASGQ